MVWFIFVYLVLLIDSFVAIYLFMKLFADEMYLFRIIIIECTSMRKIIYLFIIY